MSTAKLNGVELFYEVRGAGERLVLTHGSWTDGTGWTPSLSGLSERFEVVTWDRRGHSRSRAGIGLGSRDEDAADLAALIEHLGHAPVHVVGNSYGAIVVLTLVARRPDLVASAVLHEPPVLTLLEGVADPAVTAALADTGREVQAVLALIQAGQHRAAAERFVERVALGPGAWAQLPEPVQAIFEANAPTFLDEERDPTSRSVDTAALAGITAPVLFTHGTHSPAWFRAVITELAPLVPNAKVQVIAGAGHIPHATHPGPWVATLLAFHEGLGAR